MAVRGQFTRLFILFYFLPSHLCVFFFPSRIRSFVDSGIFIHSYYSSIVSFSPLTIRGVGTVTPRSYQHYYNLKTYIDFFLCIYLLLYFLHSEVQIQN